MPVQPTDPNPSQAKVTPGLPTVPNTNPVNIPADANAKDGPVMIKTVGAPVIPAGEVTTIPDPIKLANTAEMDPANPANAKRPEPVRSSNETQRSAQEELEKLQMGPAKDREGKEARIHELHYLAAGLEYPPK